MEDAWAAWRDYTVESMRIKVRGLETGNASLAAIVMCFLNGPSISPQCIAAEPVVPKSAGASDSCWESC